MYTYFSKVLDAICLMSVDVLKPQDPELKDIPIQILNDSRYMPHFKVKLITFFLSFDVFFVFSII